MRQEKTPVTAGQTFGYWQVQEEYTTINGLRKWKCRCQCGREKMVYENNLLTGKSKSCGCYAAQCSQKRIKDLTGQRFGRLTVIERSPNRKHGRICWRCQCDCGEECIVTSHDLTGGHTKSCGCLKKEHGNALELSGSKFGRLTALNPTDNRSYKGSVMWHCRCQCGNELEVAADDLLNGHYVSCGCKQKERQKQIYKTLHHVGNTCLEYLEKRNYRSDNTSGYQGVHKIREDKYRSTIGFNGKRYHLGYFDTLEEAIFARKKGEEQLHKNFIKYYYEWKEHADLDPEWAKKNPLNADVVVNYDKNIRKSV